MEQFKAEDWADPNLSIHRFTEAMRFAYGSRTQLGDPEFLDNDVEAFETEMLDEEHVKAIVKRITDNRSHHPSYYNPYKVYTPDDHGTSHIVTTDHSGMAVSMTTTVNLLFGAEVMEPTTGIILNNEMNDFSIPGVSNEFGFAPSEANYIRPGKRPLSSMTPIIAEFPNGTLYAAIGAAGGSRIISATAQTLWHILDHDMTAAESLAYPRMHDQLAPDRVVLEKKFSKSVGDYLKEKGHHVEWADPGSSAVQCIKRHFDGSLEAASEPRQKNSAGYTV
ncbi:Glutathione hydrolase proenzyme [Cladobotryum mycophilum]|uniref:Glutathione hydrolase proenzyme n=1 Tax=Cladobotryum mycophilum TaxID=491253 RepID=A0ABR0T013_9HYPO